VSDIVIPPELGYLVEQSPPGHVEPSQIIVHIQEAHTNYEAQRHLVDILEQLIRTHGVKLILVEGGQGDVSLASLRTFGQPEDRQEVAKKYPKAGVLSGEEYLDIVSEYPLTLWGVETNDLYQQNLDAFLQTDTFRESLRPVLASIREVTALLGPSLLSPTLNKLDEGASAFARDALDLASYAEFLERQASASGVSLDAYPHFRRFQAVRDLETQLAFDHIQQEQGQLLDQLSRQADAHQIEELKTKIAALKDGQLTQQAFYRVLAQMTTASTIDVSHYPNLSRYIRYVEDSAQINPSALAGELEQLRAALREQLASTPESRAFVAMLEELELIEHLVDLRLAPPEYERLKGLNITGVSERWERFLNEELRRQGLPTRSFERLSEVDAALPILQRFYELALARDQALVSNALAKLRETKEPVAVLITGGFHSPKISQMLKEAGVGTVVVTPTISHATDERLYRAVLKYKSGRGSLQDVMAIFAQTMAAGETTKEAMSSMGHRSGQKGALRP